MTNIKTLTIIKIIQTTVTKKNFTKLEFITIKIILLKYR